MPEVLDFYGAGEGNRTLVFSLEGCCSTIELHPRQAINYHAAQAASTVHAHNPVQAAIGRFSALTSGDSPPILRFPSTLKGGDPVSFTKRCHLAGVAR
jgi:hypothetical protein